MERTPNFQLPNWQKTDRIRMEDFSDMTARLDAALTEERTVRRQTDDTLTAAVAARGNCQIYAATYVGTGQFGPEHPNKLTFPHKPVLVLINYAPGLSLLMFQGNPQAMLLTSNTTHWNYLTWSGNSLSWYAGAVSGQMNSKDTTYYVVALLQMD